LETAEDTLAVIAALITHNGIVARSSCEVARLSGENVKIGALLFSLGLAGCFGPRPPAPDYALGTYQGEAMGGGSCPSPAGELTVVTVAKYSAFGDWYLERFRQRSRQVAIPEIGSSWHNSSWVREQGG
jgi:hypothetical protein